jgi:predicted nucleic acid-binding protein
VTEGPSDAELIQQLEEELRRLKVSDLLVQTLYTVSSLGYRRLSQEDRDLEQARLAVEALRALLPVLEGSVAEELVRDFKQVTANLQLAYADAVKDDDATGKKEPC